MGGQRDSIHRLRNGSYIRFSATITFPLPCPPKLSNNILSKSKGVEFPISTLSYPNTLTIHLHFTQPPPPPLPTLPPSTNPPPSPSPFQAANSAFPP